MLSLEEIPAFKEGDLCLGTCRLEILRDEMLTRLEDAWGCLPETGRGIVVCTDVVSRYDSKTRKGLLLEADVVEDRETFVLRSVGPGWSCLRWRESDGDTHRFIEHTFLSSEPGKGPPHIVYRQYWERREDEGLQIWAPVGSRFCGFREERR